MSWLIRTFGAAFVRKVAYTLAGLVIAAGVIVVRALLNSWGWLL